MLWSVVSFCRFRKYTCCLAGLQEEKKISSIEHQSQLAILADVKLNNEYPEPQANWKK